MHHPAANKKQQQRQPQARNQNPCQKAPAFAGAKTTATGKDGGGKGRRSKKRDELIGEQVVSPPFPIPLRKDQDDNNAAAAGAASRRTGPSSSSSSQSGQAVVWPLNQAGKQPFFLGKINRTDVCIDIMDPASVQCLYLSGFFGKGSRSKNAPIYKIKRKRDLVLRSTAAGPSLSRLQQQQQEQKGGSSLSRQQSSLTRRSPVQTRHGPKKKQWQSLLRAFVGGILPDRGSLLRQLYPPAAEKSSSAPAAATDPHYAAAADADAATAGNRKETPDTAAAAAGGRSSTSFRVTDDQSGTSESEDAESTTSSWESDSHPTGAQQGPGDTDTPADRPEILKLGLDEAYFLSYGLGVLSIVPEQSEDPFLNLDQLWSTYRRLFNPDDLMQFPVIYAAYHYFRSRGWVVKCGLKFACDFLLYDEGPPFNHSEFAVTVIRASAGQQQDMSASHPAVDWQHVNAMQRMSRGVRKKAILCHVIIGPEVTEQDFALVSVIQKMQVHCSLVQRWDPRHPDSDDSSH